MTTIAADPAALGRFRTATDAALLALTAEAGALQDALTRLTTTIGEAPTTTAPPLPSRPQPIVLPPIPPAVTGLLDDIRQSAQTLAQIATRTADQLRRADAIGRWGAPLLIRTLERESPGLALLLAAAPEAQDVGRKAGSSWWLNDAWQATQAGLRLVRLAEPEASWAAHLLEDLPELRALLAAAERVAPAALPMAGSAAGAALTVADAVTLARDGNPVHAWHRRGAGYLADGVQLGADVASSACAAAPTAPTCAAGVGANLGSIWLRRWSHGSRVPVGLPGFGIVMVEPSDVKHAVKSTERFADHVAHKAESATKQTARAARRYVDRGLALLS